MQTMLRTARGTLVQTYNKTFRSIRPQRSLCAKIRSSAQPEQQTPPSTSESQPSQTRPTPGRPVPGRPAPGRPMPGRPPVMLGPDGKPLEVVPVEKIGSEGWAGVGFVDDGKGYDWNKTGKMIAGDMTALLVFAIIGRVNHGEVLDVETLATAFPFMLGWLSSAAVLGGYGAEAQGSDVGAAAKTAAKVWAVGTPLGLVLRGAFKGYTPPVPFIIVSMVVTGVLMVGWRSALAATTKAPEPMTPAARAAARKDKQGNPFEFIQLLMSLTKRW